jgi:hypothetical protein
VSAPLRAAEDPVFIYMLVFLSYLEAYNIIRNAGGIGEGNGPFVGIHDGFLGVNNWGGFLPGSDRVTLDTHPYMAFTDQSADPVSAFANRPCESWAGGINQSMTEFGLTNAGEWRYAGVRHVNVCDAGR